MLEFTYPYETKNQKDKETNFHLTDIRNDSLAEKLIFMIPRKGKFISGMGVTIVDGIINGASLL